MSSSKETTTATEKQLCDVLSSFKSDLEDKARRFITTNFSARRTMTESTFSQVTDDIPSVAQMIHDQAARHMILNLPKPDVRCGLTSSGLRTTLDYKWSTTIKPRHEEWNTISRIYEAKFAPDTWQSVPSGSNTNTSGSFRYAEGVDKLAIDELSRTFEEILTNEIDVMGLGSDYDIASKIISKKWENECGGVCRDMGATVERGSDGTGNSSVFFFKPENISLQTLPGNGLSFEGKWNGEGWTVQGDVLTSGHRLKSVDWKLLAPRDQVESYQSTSSHQST